MKAGTATITAKSSNGKTATATVTVTSDNVADPLINKSTISTTSITLGNTVTLKGAASGGTAPYQYQMVYKKTTDTNWTTAQNFSTNTTVSIKPAKAVEYDVCIKVKDKTGTIVKKFFTLKIGPLPTATMKISATTITLGNTVTASASGGSKYAFFYKKTSDTNWTTAKDFSTTSSVAIKPAKATTYDICIKVKMSDGSIQKKYFTVTVKRGLTNTSKMSAEGFLLAIGDCKRQQNQFFQYLQEFQRKPGFHQYC